MSSLTNKQHAGVIRALRADRQGLEKWLRDAVDAARQDYVLRWLQKRKRGGSQRITHAIRVIEYGLPAPQNLLKQAEYFTRVAGAGSFLGERYAPLADVYAALVQSMSLEFRSSYLVEHILRFETRTREEVASTFSRAGLTPAATRALVTQYILAGDVWTAAVNIPQDHIANNDDLLELVLTNMYLFRVNIGIEKVGAAFAAVFRAFDRSKAVQVIDRIAAKFNMGRAERERFGSDLNDLKSRAQTGDSISSANRLMFAPQLRLLQDTCDMITDFIAGDEADEETIEVSDSDTDRDGIPSETRSLHVDDARLIGRLFGLPDDMYRDRRKLLRLCKLKQQEQMRVLACKNENEPVTGEDITDCPYMFVLSFLDRQCILVGTFCRLEILRCPSTQEPYTSIHVDAAERRVRELLEDINDF